MRRFPFQFMLTDRDTPGHPGWACQQAGGWKLYTDPELPILTVRARNGGRLGWLLGFPRGTDGTQLSGRPDVSRDNVEEWLYTHGGRYALILMSPEPRVYLDPFGSYSVVYSQAQRTVASSIGLVPGGDPDAELIHTFDIPNKDCWYPFGVTQRFDVSRLLPNHYLDLQDWSMHRHWPRKGDLGFTFGDREIFDRMADLVERQIGAITAVSPCYLFLTAGQDSRMLLACAHRYIQKVRIVTLDVGDSASDLDCRIAGRLTDRLSLPHTVIQRKQPSAEQLDEWQANTGHCVAGRVWKNTATRSSIDANLPSLSGLGGEIGRGYWWRPGDGAYATITVPELLKRMSLPATDRVVRAGQAWMDGLPAKLNNKAILELAYIEQRLGCWAGPQQFGYVGNAPSIMPLCHRELVRLMLSLSAEAREQGLMSREVIRRKWPELLALPFNQDVGVAGQVQRVKSQVVRVRDGLRRRVARLVGTPSAGADARR